ncbi:MAG: tetratricopeptide repeat protein [Polyangiales bacterium]|nr:tetratricopeptide repeat protein [Myxococcales bacterium]MCB9656657.1 tetratricopeptide repeat protein [Sandaracinaceae bacterium]
MSEANELHNRAMALVESALGARRRGDHAEARDVFAEAQRLELASAQKAETQPSRSILFRSAAWLALEAEDASEAERLAACGLADIGVPNKVKVELRAVAEEARLRLHQPLPPPTAMSSVTLHLEGPAVGYGTASAGDVDRRKGALQSIIVRTAERRARRPFRLHGGAPRDVVRQLQPRLSYAAGSMVVQVVLGGDQRELWDENAAVVEDVQRCLLAFSEGGTRALRAPIADDLYRENFAQLATQLAPDGKRVTSVDVLVATATGSQKPVRMRRHGSEDRKAKSLPVGPALDVLEGELRGVDETTPRNTIKILLSGANATAVSVQVGDAVMEDIVRPLYGRVVRVTVATVGKQHKLIGVPELVDDDES